MKSIKQILEVKKSYKDKLCPKCQKVMIYRHSDLCKTCSNSEIRKGMKYHMKKKPRKNKAKVEIINFEKPKKILGRGGKKKWKIHKYFF